MIWASIPLMTTFDLLVLLAVAVSLGMFIRSITSGHSSLLNTGSLLIISGLFTFGLFYFIDLLIMQVMPLYYPMADAMALMEALHHNFQWFFSLFTVTSIVIGFLIVNRTQETLIREYETSKAELKESETRFKDITDLSSDRFWEMDENFCFSSMLDHPESTFLLPPEAFIGRTRWDLAGVDPDTNEKWHRHRDDHLAHRPYRGFEYSISGEDGTTHHLSVSGSPVFDHTGTFKGYRGSATDITKHKEVEQILQSEGTRKLLEAALENIEQGLAVYDDEDRLIYCNTKYTDSFLPEIAGIVKPGATFEGILRAAAHLDFFDAGGQTREEAIQGRLEQHRNPNNPYEVPLPGGRWASYSEYKTKEGGTVLLRLYITDRKKAEERFRTAIESMPEGFAYYEPDDRLAVVNSKILKSYPLMTDVFVPGVSYETCMRTGVERGQWGPEQGEDKEE
jgi:PAS domain S-box-containing protein